jgi:tetratricopeptide (TPR) repeat protein
MHDNRDKIRLGLPPAGPPPVPQSKIEELVLQILPLEVSEVQQKQRNDNDLVLPSKYTIDQLLKSFSGYHRWMGEAAKSGTVDSFTVQLQQLKPIDTEDEANFIERICTKSSLLYQRGRRYAFEKQYERAVSDFDKALELITREEMREKIANFMDTKEYVRIYEWGGMCRHLRYDLKGAEQCYDKCLEIEPNNVSEGRLMIFTNDDLV